MKRASTKRFRSFPILSILSCFGCALFPGIARAAVALAPTYRVSGMDPALFHVERIDFVFKGQQYVAAIQVFISPKLGKVGSSVLLNENQPLQIIKDRARIEIALHPGPNSLSLTRVGVRGETLQWFIEISPQPSWQVAASCASYRASWEAIDAPVSTWIEAICEPNASDPTSVHLVFHGIEVSEIRSASGAPLTRAKQASFAAWQSNAAVEDKIEIPVSIQFGPAGKLKPARAKLVLRPPLPFKIRFQAGLGISSLSASQLGVSGSQIGPHLWTATYSPFLGGRFEARFEAAASNLEASMRLLTRWPVWPAALQNHLAPFLDLGAGFLIQLATPSPISPSQLLAPLAGGGIAWEFSSRASLALAGHFGLYHPADLASASATSLNKLWDAGAWLTWKSDPVHGTIWFLRARYLSTTIDEGVALNGTWSALNVDLGWGGRSGASERGGMGVGL